MKTIDDLITREKIRRDHIEQDMVEPLKTKINTYEHEVGTFTNGFLNLYFYISSLWIITPEQIQGNKDKPDFTVERLINNEMHHYILI